MAKMKTTARGNHSVTLSIVIGIVAALVVTFLLTGGLTSLLISGKLGESVTGILIFAIRTISVLLGGLIGSGYSNGRYLQVIALITLGYMVALLGLGMIVYNGTFHNLGMGILSVFVGSLIACLVKIKPKRAGKHVPRIR